MKVEFQIAHQFKDNVATLLAQAVQQTFDEYLEEVELSEISDSIETKYNYYSNNHHKLCGFSLDIDLDNYSLYDHESFVNMFALKVKEINGLKYIIRLFDDSRIDDYIGYYREISEIEMKLREIISFILIDCLGDEYYNLLGGQRVLTIIKNVSENDRPNILSERLENELYFLTFNQYRNIGIPSRISTEYMSDILDKYSDTQVKKEIKKLRIFNTTDYKSFLAKISSDLESIETIRNCVAHNRSYTTEELGSYEKAKTNLSNAIDEFWYDYNENEITFADNYAAERVSDLLSVAEWNDYKNEVAIYDFWASGEHWYRFHNLKDLKEFLIHEANTRAISQFPSNEEDREVYEKLYKGGENIVKTELKKFKSNLKVMGWLK